VYCPRVSILIPVYNAAGFLSEAVSSALCQNYRDFELLIADNCSTDETLAIARGFAAQDDRIRIVAHDTNRGMVANWNYCLQEAQGEYVKFMFGDDRFCSDQALGRMVARIVSDETTVLVACGRRLIDEASAVIGTAVNFVDAASVSGKEVINLCLKYDRNLVGEPSAVLFRKKDAERGFEASLRQIVDLEMWVYLLEKGSFAYIEEPLVDFRVHTGQQTEKNRHTVEVSTDGLFIQQHYFDKEYLSLGAVHKWFLRYRNSYYFWKLYGRKIISRAKALEEIGKAGSLSLFWLGYPLFKCYKLFFDYQARGLQQKPLRLSNIARSP